MTSAGSMVSTGPPPRGRASAPRVATNGVISRYESRPLASLRGDRNSAMPCTAWSTSACHSLDAGHASRHCGATASMGGRASARGARGGGDGGRHSPDPSCTAATPTMDVIGTNAWSPSSHTADDASSRFAVTPRGLPPGPLRPRPVVQAWHPSPPMEPHRSATEPPGERVPAPIPQTQSVHAVWSSSRRRLRAAMASATMAHADADASAASAAMANVMETASTLAVLAAACRICGTGEARGATTGIT